MVDAPLLANIDGLRPYGHPIAAAVPVTHVDFSHVLHLSASVVRCTNDNLENTFVGTDIGQNDLQYVPFLNTSVTPIAMIVKTRKYNAVISGLLKKPGNI